MWLKKMKKKKVQFLLVSIMLCFTSIIFAACISFAVETSAFTKDYVSYQKCPAVEAVCKEDYDISFFEKYPDLMAKTDRIEKCDVTLLNNNFWFQDKQMKTFLNLAYHVDTIDNFMHDLKLIQGEGICPKDGEIWINSVLADSYGIQVGDTIHLDSKNGKAFQISGIVATPICPSPYIGTLPYYVNENTAKQLNGNLLKGYSLFSNEAIASQDYRNLVPEEFIMNALTTVDANVISTSISYIATIFGGVGILAAIIVFFVSLIVIRFIIISTLAKEYVEIGTYKALGFTERQITSFYLKCFLVSGLIGILIGVLLSFPIAQYLCSIVLGHIGAFEITKLSIYTGASVFILLTVFLVLGVLLSLHRTRKITPVEAFSIETVSSKKKIGKSLIKNAYSPFSTAVNDIARKMKSSLITIAVLTVSFYMAVLFISVNYSLQRMNELTGQWFTFPEYTGLIYTNGHNEAYDDYLSNSNLVKNYLYCNLDIDLSGIRSDYDIDMKDLYVEVYEDCSEEALGLPLVKGRHPQAEDEILMSYDMARKLGLSAGEWFHMESDSYSNSYLITGIFSSMFNGGLNILMDGEEFARFEKPDDYIQILVFAKDKVTYEQLETEMKKEFPDINMSETEAFLERSEQSLNSISKPLTTLFAIIFSIFSVLNIINLLMMNNIENRRQYGILKAFGFTNGYICVKNLLQIGLLTVLSAVLAFIIHLTLSPKIFFGVIHVNGLIWTPQLTVLVISVLFAVIMFTTAMFTLPLRKIAPTELMEE